MSDPVIEYRPGASFLRVFKWRRGGAHVRLDGVTAVFEVVFSVRGAPVLRQQCQVDAELGDVYVELTAEQIGALGGRTARCRIVLSYAGGVQHPISWCILRPERVT